MPRDADAPLRIAVIADTSSAASLIARALREIDGGLHPLPTTLQHAHERVRDLDAPAVLLRAGPRNFPLASALARAAATYGPALIVLTPSGSRQSTKLALEVGAHVHLVEPFPAQALVAAVRIALARAGDLREMRSTLTKTRESLHARRAIERAKAVLMRRLGLTEEQAHRRLQQESRNRNRRLAETAWQVIRADGALAAKARTAGAEPPDAQMPPAPPGDRVRRRAQV